MRARICKPVTGPEDLAGLRLLLQPAGIEEAAARALGAEPVGGAVGAELGDLDGAVQQLASIRSNRYDRDARFITADAVLWPRPLVVFAGADDWERLSDAQRSILLDAGRAAIAPAVTAIEDADAAALEDICTGGGLLVRAGAGGRAALQAALAPVYEQLRERPATAHDIDAIERMRASAPPAQSPRCASAPPEPAAQAGGIPPGTYVATVTERDTSELDRTDPVAQARRVRFRAVFTPGHLVVYESLDGAPEDIGLEADYTVFRDRLELVAADGAEITMRWSGDGGRLRFTDVEGPGPGDAVVLGSQPWVRARQRRSRRRGWSPPATSTAALTRDPDCRWRARQRRSARVFRSATGVDGDMRRQRRDRGRDPLETGVDARSPCCRRQFGPFLNEPLQ